MALDVPAITNTCRHPLQHPCQGAHKSKIYSFNGPNSLFWPIKVTPIHIYMKIKEILGKEMNKGLAVPINHPLQPSSSSPVPGQHSPHSLDCASSYCSPFSSSQPGTVLIPEHMLHHPLLQTLLTPPKPPGSSPEVDFIPHHFPVSFIKVPAETPLLYLQSLFQNAFYLSRTYSQNNSYIY